MLNKLNDIISQYIKTTLINFNLTGNLVKVFSLKISSEMTQEMINDLHIDRGVELIVDNNIAYVNIDLSTVIFNQYESQYFNDIAEQHI